MIVLKSIMSSALLSCNHAEDLQASLQGSRVAGAPGFGSGHN